MSFLTQELIKKKKHGIENTPEEIRWLIKNYSLGEIPDYQMSAWAMAVWFKGMTPLEIATLTDAMRLSGKTFNFSGLGRPRIDKHSTGGVGDKTSLIIGPILAAAGVAVPMIAGRGLGHTGGTIDKLHSLPGFRMDLTREQFEAFVREHHFALIGQTSDICPADKKLYALRDVTATVDSLPLICGSIMSKKLAENLTGLVLDVKFGSGAFMKTLESATELAQLLKSTGEQNGLKVTAVLSNMNAPLGRYVGNALEVHECVEIMSGKKCLDADFDYYASTRELSLILAGHMLLLADRAKSAEAGYQLANEILNSGKALVEFNKLLERQGPTSVDRLPKAQITHGVVAPRSGRIVSMNVELLGLAAIELGAGRKKVEDPIDYSAGFEVLCHLGQVVTMGQPLFRIHSNSKSNINEVERQILLGVEIHNADQNHFENLPLVAKVLT